MITRAGIIYLASVAAHGALAVGIVSLKGPKKFEDVSISMVETKKKEKEKPNADEPPPPPPTKEPPAPVKAKAAPAPAPVEATPPSDVPSGPMGEAAPDFGLSLGGGSGPGLAVRAAAPVAPVASAAPAPVHKVLAAPVPTAKCDEPPKKPRPIAITQPGYTAEARTANIAGKVRVEITVDETGHVTKVRVLEGLGYGLDEAALAAARAATFEPGTLCGKPTTATFTVAMRFTL